jgi:hypothetical protein
MCAVGGTSNLNNLNATKQPPSGVECSRERRCSPALLPIFSEASFPSLTYHKNASERPIVVFSKRGLCSEGSQFEFRHNIFYSERDF